MRIKIKELKQHAEKLEKELEDVVKQIPKPKER
jgi:predicted ATP-grasp superfamily ATP-dependent carboligase